MAPGGHNLPRRRPHESLPRNRRQRRRNLAPQTYARPDPRSRHNPLRVRRPMRLELFLLNRVPLASLILNWRGLDWISPVVLHLHPPPAASARIYPLSEHPPYLAYFAKYIIPLLCLSLAYGHAAPAGRSSRSPCELLELKKACE